MNILTNSFLYGPTQLIEEVTLLILRKGLEEVDALITKEDNGATPMDHS
jgi:hypothetical protein